MEAARRADSLDPDTVAEYLRRSFMQTFFGTYSYSSENILLMSGHIFQYFNGSRVTVGPLAIQDGDLVAPMPTWPERETRTGLWGVEIASIIVIAIAITVLFICAIFLIMYRAHPNIIAGSPVFLAAMLFGSLLIYIGLLLSLPSRLTTVTCILKPWFIAIGSTLLFGAIFAKTWRIYSLWRNHTVKVFRISDFMVAGVLALFLIPDIPLLIAYTVIGHVTASPVIVDPYRPSKNYVDCRSTATAAPALIWSLFGWHVRLCNSLFNFWFVSLLLVFPLQMVLFVIGAVFAWRVRRIPLKIYDESKAIAFSIYNVGFFGIILAVLLSVATTDYLVLYGILVFLATVGTLITVALIFGTKLNFVLSHDGSRASTSGGGSGSSSTANLAKAKPSTIPAPSGPSEMQTLSMQASQGSYQNSDTSPRTSDLRRQLKKAHAKIDRLQERVKQLGGALDSS
jgi:hypothetical protein